jgi:hypothetical protein
MEHLGYKMENISITIQNNRVTNSYRDANFYSAENAKNNLDNFSVNDIDDNIIYELDEIPYSDGNLSVFNNYNVVIPKTILKKKKKARRRIKFNEKRKKLNYYDRLFRYNRDSDN